MHYLNYYGKDDNDEYEYDIEHDGCPEYEQYSGVTAYECGIGFSEVAIGVDIFGVWDNALDSLPPGRYPIVWRQERNEYGPYRTVEYDEWIEIGDKIDS